MMTCHQAQQHIERQAIGDDLSAEDSRALESHVANCQRCYLRQVWEYRINEELRRESVPAPTADFETRVMAAATGKTSSRGGVLPKVGSAIAAALALAVVAASLWLPERGPLPEQAGNSQSTGAEEVALGTAAPGAAWSQEQTVRLAFNSASQLDDVSLTLELPPNVELARFPGHQHLTWEVDLKPGDNIIALPLRIAYPQAGELVAHLDDGKKRKTFRAPIPGLAGLDQEPSL